MDYIFTLTREFLLNYGILAVFLIGVIEEVFFIIPSSLIFLATGFFIIDPGLSFWPALGSVLFNITVWGALGVTVGSFFVYGVAYWGGKFFIDKYGRYFGISWEEIRKVEERFSAGRADETVIFILRALPIWSITIVSAFCGLIRISWKTFGLYTFIGTAFRITILGMLGWKFGEAYQYFGEQLSAWEKYGTISLAVLGVAVLFYFYKKYAKK